LKGILERGFSSLDTPALEYIKKEILKFYLHPKTKIRKTISILINTLIKEAGLEKWPEILGILYSHLDNELGTSMSLETLILIFEDHSKLIENHHSQVN
jgi:hypothetical protein